MKIVHGNILCNIYSLNRDSIKYIWTNSIKKNGQLFVNSLNACGLIFFTNIFKIYCGFGWVYERFTVYCTTEITLSILFKNTGCSCRSILMIKKWVILNYFFKGLKTKVAQCWRFISLFSNRSIASRLLWEQNWTSMTCKWLTLA